MTRPPAALISTFLVAAAVRLVVFFQLHAHPLLQAGDANDTDAYLQLADRVAGGDLLLGPGAFYVSPLYVYFLGAVRAAGGSLDAIRIVQLALGVAGCLLVGDAARRIAGARAGLFAGLLAAACSLFVFYEVLILQAALDPFLSAVDLWFLVRAAQSGRGRDAALAGAAFGLHTLNRPNMIVAAGVVAFGWLAVRGMRRGTAPAAVFAAGLMAAVLPVTARNYAVTGDAILLSSHGGLNLYIGNNPRADGTYTAIPGITPSIQGQASDTRAVVSRAIGRPASDADVSRHFRGLALAWWRDQPVQAAALFVRKLYYVLHAQFLTLNYSFPFYAHDERTLLRWLPGPGLIMPLGLAGLGWLLWKQRTAQAVMAALSVAAIALSVALFFVAARYRLPMLVPLAIGAGALIDRMLVRAEGWPAAAAAAVLLAAALNMPIGLYDARADERTRYAVWAIQQGSPDREAAIARALDGHPMPGTAHVRFAQAFASAGDRDAAGRHLDRARALDAGLLVEAPRDRVAEAAALEARGVAAAQRGDHAAAIRDLTEAAMLDPASARIQLNLAVAFAQRGEVEDVEKARTHARAALRLRPGYAQAEGLLRSLPR